MGLIDLTGNVYGRLVVVHRAEDRRIGVAKKNRPYWLCRCACGKDLIVSGTGLRNGGTRSCGCLRDDMSADRAARLKLRHGMTGTPEYEVWQAMKGRCLRRTSKDYPQYGGRGIKVCERWLRFDEFIADMGRRPSEDHSLDRIDTNGDYEPSNCRWATPTEQANNKRSNKKVTVDGQEMTIAEAARATGENASTLYGRVARKGKVAP